MLFPSHGRRARRLRSGARFGEHQPDTKRRRSIGRRPGLFKCVFEGFFRKSDNPVEKLDGICARRLARRTADGSDNQRIADDKAHIRILLHPLNTFWVNKPLHGWYRHSLMSTENPPNSGISDPPDDVSGAAWLTVDDRPVFGVWRTPKVAGKPALVFLHDGLGSVGTMRRFPEQTGAAMGLPSFVFDRLGYGRSDREEKFPTDFMGEAADHLERVLDAAGIENCCLVGHSDGGTVALLHGARYRGRVRAIVTIAAHVRRDELTYGQVMRHNEMFEAGEIPDWMERFHGSRAAHLMKCWTDVWQKTLYDSWDISDEVAGIEAPLMSIQGSEDAYGLPSQLESIGNAVSHARIEMIDGLGHFPQLEDSERVVGLVKGFLEPYCR